jgi:cephalosporin hydroxylase/predicted SAM-dependent methyltransferase
MSKWQLNTPVALIIFNRTDTTQKVFEAIREAKPPKLLVISDAPRTNKEGEAEQCTATRAIINQVDWECEVLTNHSDVNLGPRKRISSGVDWVFEQVEEAIIFEHDCLPDLTFFRYCEELLEKYRDDERIMMISGNNFQFGTKRSEDSYYFSRYSHIWGFATWRRAWKKYDVSIQKWNHLKESTWLYDFLQNEQAATYWSKIFEAVSNGFDTWDYSLLFSLWINEGFCILPEVNLVSNIGFGSNAENCKDTSSPLANMLVEAMEFPLQHPPAIVRNSEADDFTEKYIFSGVPNRVTYTNSCNIPMEELIKFVNNNEHDKLLEIINNNFHHKPSSILYLKALAESRLGYISEAKNSLYTLLAQIPNHVKGKQLLQEISQDSPKEAEAILQEALNYFNKGDRIKALRLGEKAADLGTFVPGLHYLRSVFNTAVARYEEALEAAQKELEHNPNHVEAQQQVAFLTKALIKPKKVKIPNEQRTWNTALPHDLMMSIQNSLHNYSYRGVPIQKNPFDFAIYPFLIWKLKPQTIIEIGSKSGGSALWFGDLLNNFAIEGHVYSVDIVKVTKYSHSNVTFMEGDGQNLQETFSSDFLKKLPRPLLVIEDADHSYQTSKAVLDFFHPYLEQNEYIVIEDGIISDIVQDKSYSSGPHQALKAFLAEYNNEYEIDSEYCDFFAYNLTWATNGYLKKLTPANIQSLNLSDLKESDQSNVTQVNPIAYQTKLPTTNRKWLNLGCGGCFHPEWTNIDFHSTGEGVIAHNLLKGIPFPDRSFEVVYHSHLLEHLPKNETELFLKECYRVLEFQGIVRVVIPDLEQIAKLYLTSLEKALAGSKEDADNYNWIMLEMYDQVVRNESGGDMKRYLAQNPLPNEKFIIERFGCEGEMLVEAFKGRNFPYLSLSELNSTQIGQFRQSGEVHQWMYDRYSLGVLLEKVGFSDIKVCQADESRISDFNNYYLDVLPDGRVRKSDSLFMEAIKPENS